MNHNLLNVHSICAKEIHTQSTAKSHVLPICASSSFTFDDFDESVRVFNGQEKGFVYSRYGNPTIEALSEKIRQLESYGLNDDTFCIITSSGMSAISTLLTAILNPGDAILTQEDLYGGTTELFHKILEKFAIRIIFCDLRYEDQIDQAFSSHTDIKVIYAETPANPTMRCVNLKTLALKAQQYNALSIVDNTFCTPIIQQPLLYNIDYVIHSTTKYLNGHGNAILGAIIGRMDQRYSNIWQNMKLLGSNANPFDAWLTYMGIKTLALRMKTHSSNALLLAQFLSNHPAVQKVNYCGLPEHVDHAIAKNQMRMFGGMLSFEIKGEMPELKQVIDSFKVCTLAPTLGDVDTLVLHPMSSSHLKVDPEVCKKNGITPTLLRVSVGIENIEDIIRDFDQALSNIS